LEHDAVLFLAHHNYIRPRIRHRFSVSEAGHQPARPSGAAKLIGEHPPGYPIQPSQRSVTIRNIIETTPRHQECLCQTISGRLGVGAATAEGVDLTVMPIEQPAIPLL
jgi:hypothetical protein